MYIDGHRARLSMHRLSCTARVPTPHTSNYRHSSWTCCERTECARLSLRVSFFFFSSRRRHTRSDRDWSSDVCSSDLGQNSGFASGHSWVVAVYPTAAYGASAPDYSTNYSLATIATNYGLFATNVKIGRASCRERV